MNRFFSTLLDWFFPPRCVYCARILESSQRTSCPECEDSALWVPDDVPPVKGNHCSACCFSAWYQDEIREAFLAFKFQGRTEYANSFSAALARSISLHFSGQYELLTWLPVSAGRKRERGFDQSFLLAKAAAARLEQPLISTLEKSDTKTQSSLTSFSERRANVQGAFHVTDPSALRGKTVLLVDDLITTGSTLEAAAQALLEAGAAQVLGACFAGSSAHRAEHPFA